MLTIPAKTVYIDPEVRSRPNCKRRLDRVLPYIRCWGIRDLTPEAIRRHGKNDFGDDAVLVSTTFDEERYSWFYHWRNEPG